jgi:hypothetical protein
MRMWLGLSLLGAAASSMAQTVQLPSVPVGASLSARVTLSSLGAPSLAGIPIALTIPGNCGSFQGQSTREVTTDASASFDFIFTPGSTPGVCTIEGRNGNFVGRASTTIYRPSEATISTDIPMRRGWPSTFLASVTVKARGLPLYGVPVTIDQPVGTPGASATVTLPFGALTNPNGAFLFDVHLAGTPGVIDFAVHAFGATQKFRVAQLPPDTAPPVQARSMLVIESFAALRGETRLSIANGSPNCWIDRAYRNPVGSSALPPGMADFPQDLVYFELAGCAFNGPTTLRLEYPTALPADGVVHISVPYAVAPSGWVAIPGSVSGNSVTFTVTDNAPGDSVTDTNAIKANIGVSKPGVHVDIPKPDVHDMWWVGPQENGWGVSMARNSDGTVFGAIYAYDDSGRPTWWVLPNLTFDSQRQALWSGVYSTYGTPFYDYETQFTISNIDGAGRFTPTDASHVTFDYAINGVTGRKALQRQVFGSADSTSTLNVNGMWWGGAAQSGWGISIVQQLATLFSVWYTYDELNRPTWFVMPGGRWTNATTYEGRIYKTRGTPWLGRAYDPSQLQVTDVGPYRFTFTGGNALFAYTIEGKSGSLALTRQSAF